MIRLDDLGALTEKEYNELSEKELAVTKYCKGEVVWTQKNQCSEKQCATLMGQTRRFRCEGDICPINPDAVIGWVTKKPCKKLVDGKDSEGSYVACKVKFKKIEDCVKPEPAS